MELIKVPFSKKESANISVEKLVRGKEGQGTYYGGDASHTESEVSQSVSAYAERSGEELQEQVPPFVAYGMLQVPQMVPQQVPTEHEQRKEMKALDHAQMKDIMWTKELISQENARFLSDLALRKELATREVLAGTDGKLYLAIKATDKKDIGAKILCNAENLKCTAYCCDEGYGVKCIFEVKWSQASKTGTLYIDAADMAPATLAKELAKRGVAVQAKADTLKTVTDLLYAYILSIVEVVRLPRKMGWSKADGRWKWVRKGTLTMMEVENCAV